MGITFTTGATAAVAKTFGTSFTITTITNAAEATITTGAAHSIAVGDYVEVTSGWSRLDKRVVRAGTGTTGSTLVLDDFDTTSTTRFPAGEGVGSVRAITDFTTLTQVKNIGSSGGEAKLIDVSTLADFDDKQAIVGRSAVSMTMDVYDDPSLGWYADVVAADESQVPYGLLLTLANGTKLVANAYWSINRVPTLATGEAVMTKITLAYAAQPIRYAA